MGFSWDHFFLLLFLHLNIRGAQHVSNLPRFTWLDNYNIQVLFPTGIETTIKLWPTEKFGNFSVSCLYEGVLEVESSSSIAVSGCHHDELVHIVIYTSLLPHQNMFNIRNGVTEEVKMTNFVKNNADIEESDNGRLKKRSISLEDDYDEASFDGAELSDLHPFLSLDVKLAFEETLLSKTGSEDAAREYIARVFTLGKKHLQHATLGISIRLRAQGPIRKISNKFWKPNRADLKESINSKEQDNAPVTYFCNNDDGSSIMGISYKRKGCHETKGVAIVNYQTDIIKAAQTYIHECGHWFGFDEDLEEDRYRDTNCEGTGIMSRLNTPEGRPSTWSICSKNRLRKWLNRPDNNCHKEDTKELQMDNAYLGAKHETTVNSIPKCETVIVSGADCADCNGEYSISNDRVRWLPSRPVYAHISLDRYIYWNARGYVWSIGKKEDLQTGDYYQYSGLDSQEPWEAPWGNGTTVECKGEIDSRLQELEKTCNSTISTFGHTLQSGCQKPANFNHGKWLCIQDGSTCHAVCNPGHTLSLKHNQKPFMECFQNSWVDYSSFECVEDSQYLPPSSLPTIDVLCGGHRAEDCSKCPPPGQGAWWCHGDCTWIANKCTSKTSSTECWTKEGVACIFPFAFEGKLYENCTGDPAWCPTEVTSDGQYINGKHGSCKTCYSPSYRVYGTGDAFKIQGGTMGEYTKIEKNHNGFPAYTKKTGSIKFLHVGGNGEWIIGSTMDGSSLNIRHIQNDPTLSNPPLYGWQFFNGSTWISDANLKVIDLSDLD